jgi:hypothetical protein
MLKMKWQLHFNGVNLIIVHIIDFSVRLMDRSIERKDEANLSSNQRSTIGTIIFAIKRYHFSYILNESTIIFWPIRQGFFQTKQGFRFDVTI